MFWGGSPVVTLSIVISPVVQPVPRTVTFSVPATTAAVAPVFPIGSSGTARLNRPSTFTKAVPASGPGPPRAPPARSTFDARVPAAAPRAIVFWPFARLPMVRPLIKGTPVKSEVGSITDPTNTFAGSVKPFPPPGAVTSRTSGQASASAAEVHGKRIGGSAPIEMPRLPPVSVSAAAPASPEPPKARAAASNRRESWRMLLSPSSMSVRIRLATVPTVVPGACPRTRRR